MTFKPPSPPYLGPAAHTTAGHNKPIDRVVLHSTVSPCMIGEARSVAEFFRNPKAEGSAHYVVDPVGPVQVCYDDVIAWHAPPNQHSLGVEMCDEPSKLPGRWRESNHRKVLDKTARLVAQLCLAYDVPIVWLSSADLIAGKKGITTHNNVSQAFHESTHWDPGWFPRGRFMRLVRKYAAEERAKVSQPMSRTATNEAG